MARIPSLALVLALCPAFASAQAVGAAARSGDAASVSAAGAATHGAVTPIPALGPSNSLSVPSLSVPLSASALVLPGAPVSAAAAAVQPAASAVAPAAARALSAKAAAGDGPTPFQEPIRPGGPDDVMVHDGPRGRLLVPLSSYEAPETPDGWTTSRSRLNKTFDGSKDRDDAAADGPVTGSYGAASAPLARPSAVAAAAPASVPAPASPARSRAASLGWKIALAVALMVLTPGIALAQTATAPVVITAATTLSILAALRPAASVLGGIAGAVYGMTAARPKDGTEASSGEMFASVLRYGAIGAAGVYMLFDVSSLVFTGPTGAGLQPLSSAVVTAALGRTAFQGKFMDAATTSADRIVGAFPAVAAALGISLAAAVGFVAPPLAVTIALGAMSATGVMTAVYTALFKLGRSPLDGPALMGKGYVLQALMTGLALAVSNPWLHWPFALMGAWGFGLVLWAMGRELLSFLPGRAVPAPAPTTPPAPPSGGGPKA